MAVFALLAMQVAVAAYACPYERPTATDNSGMGPDCAAGMAGADQPNLCKAHNDAPSQLKGDYASTALMFAPFVAAFFLTLSDISIHPRVAQTESYQIDRLAADGSPPLFLRLQVLRT